MLCDLKREKKVWQKEDLNTGRSRQKGACLTIYTTEADAVQESFYNVDCPNHILVGGVSVNSLCHQGGPFALSVNRHSEKIYFGLKLHSKFYICIFTTVVFATILEFHTYVF